MAASITNILEQSNLHYVTNGDPGYRRARWGRGFTYYCPQGQRVRDRQLRARFETLIIPPAWQSVWICADEWGHIQSTGRDQSDRKQYIYHAQWQTLRNQHKFDKLLQFGERLPSLRRQISADLQTAPLSRRFVLATALRLMDETLIRIGNAHYAERHGTVGLTTLQNDHFEPDPDGFTLDFVGKSGVEHEITVENKQLAQRLHTIQELPGERLLQYVDYQGEVQQLDSADVNSYMRSFMGEQFSAKDFRTWGGSVLALDLLSASDPKPINAAVEQVSAALGNTPAVCRKYYIHPLVLSLAEEDALPTKRVAEMEWLDSAETIFLALLTTNRT